MDLATKPRIDLAQTVLPPPLLCALRHVFAQDLGAGTMLVGGTALAGFYAGHRRSDDLDLFCASELDYRGAVLAMKSLSDIGTSLDETYHSHQFSHANAELDGHLFTVDVVLDESVFRVGRAYDADGIQVASLDTLLKMKAATLVSRCGEKDLYDLLWILEHQDLSIDQLLDLGTSIDAGVNLEAVLMSVSQARLREDACDFGLHGREDRKQIFREVGALKDALERALSLTLQAQPVPPLGETVKRIRELRKKS